MRNQRKSLGTFTRQCVAFYRRLAYYRNRIRMIESELGHPLEVC